MPHPASQPDPAPQPDALYSTRAKIVMSLVVTLGVLAIALAVWASSTGVDDDGPVVATGGAAPLDGFRLRPADGAQAVQGSEIGIDLQPGWEGRLLIDGVEIPEDELRLVPGQNQVFFTPGQGRTIERLRPGRNCVTAIFWRSQLGRGADDGQLTWCFQVI
jgi:hypothetical protein